MIKSGLIDPVLLGRPALSNPHWPAWSARELGYDNPFGLVPEDGGWWLRNLRADQESIGFPMVSKETQGAAAAVPTSGPRVASAVDVEPGAATLDGAPLVDAARGARARSRRAGLRCALASRGD